MSYLYIVPVVAVIALAFVGWLAYDVLRRDTGTAQMLEVHRTINEGAVAFLRRQYTTIGILAVVTAVIIGILIGLVEKFPEVARFRNPWLMLAVPGGFSAILLTFPGLWGVPYLVSQYGFSTRDAALTASAMLVAWALGSVVFGPLSERLGRRKPLMAASLVVTLALWSVVTFVPGLPRGGSACRNTRPPHSATPVNRAQVRVVMPENLQCLVFSVQCSVFSESREGLLAFTEH